MRRHLRQLCRGVRLVLLQAPARLLFMVMHLASRVWSRSHSTVLKQSLGKGKTEKPHGQTDVTTERESRKGARGGLRLLAATTMRVLRVRKMGHVCAL